MKSICTKPYRYFFLFVMVFFFRGNAQQQQKVLHPAPIPNFTVTGQCFGDTTLFTNTTQMGTYFTWTISVGAADSIDTLFTSQHSDISYYFSAMGTYHVSLVADNGHVVEIIKDIVIDTATHANFEFFSCQGQFINLSTCSGACLWDFGDGSTSTVASPAHNYSTGGSYNVMLVAEGASTSDTLVKSITVPNNNLTGHFNYIMYNDTVFFTAIDSSFGFNVQYHWSYGDGTFDDYGNHVGYKTAHAYAKNFSDTTYTVFLLVRTVCNQAYSQGGVFIPGAPRDYEGVAAFPNPVTDGTIHLRSEWYASLSAVSMVNSLGQEIPLQFASEKMKGIDLDVKAFPRGVYILKLLFGADRVNKKIIID